MNVTNYLLSNDCKRLKSVQGKISIDPDNRRTTLEGTWEGRKIKFTSIYRNSDTDLTLVLGDFERTLKKIKHDPHQKNTLMGNRFRLMFIHVEEDLRQKPEIKKEIKNEDRLDIISQGKKRSAPSIQEATTKKCRATFAEKDEVSLVFKNLHIIMTRNQSVLVKDEFGPDNIKKLELKGMLEDLNLMDAVDRLYFEARADLSETLDLPAIVARMTELNNQTAVFTQDEFSQLLKSLTPKRKYNPNNVNDLLHAQRDLRGMFKTSITINVEYSDKLQLPVYIIKYKLIDHNILEKVLNNLKGVTQQDETFECEDIID
jgi:hypothetical protein